MDLRGWRIGADRRSAFAAALWLLALVAGGATVPPLAPQDNPHLVVYEGTDGPGAGKHIVLIAGDHEYRGEILRRILQKSPKKAVTEPSYGRLSTRAFAK